MGDPAIWLAIFSALFGCYFTALNYALVDMRRSRLIELLAARRSTSPADALERWRGDLLLTTALLRTVFNLLILIATIDLFIGPEAEIGLWWGRLAASLGVTGLIIAVFGVAIPLSWSRHAAEPLFNYSLGLLVTCGLILSPVLIVLHWFDPLVRRLLGVPKPTIDDTSPLEREILEAVSEGEKTGLVDQSQRDMIEAVVDFSSITVDQIMTPRTDVEGIDVNSSLEDIKHFVAEAGHSRIPIYEGDLDHIAGILYVKDLIALLGTDDHNSFNLKENIREAMFVPETKPLSDLLTQFKASKVHLAMVLDEYGGTAGLVTIEDLLEEIVGDIQDEYEPPEEEPAAIQVNPHTYDVHARLRIDEFNDELEADLPDEEDYDTIGGFVFAHLGRIPESGETFTHDSLRFTITDAEKTRVNRVRVERLEGDEPQSESAVGTEQPAEG